MVRRGDGERACAACCGVRPRGPGRRVSLERAFEMAVDLEGSELEDVVVDMLSRRAQPALARAGHPAPDPRSGRPVVHGRALHQERAPAGARRCADRAARAAWAAPATVGTRAATARSCDGCGAAQYGTASRASIPGLPCPAYLAAVRTMHGLGPAEMARALRVSPSVVRRWTRGTLVPPWRACRRMTALWGGNAELLGARGRAATLLPRATGVSLDEAVRMIRTGQRTARDARRVAPRAIAASSRCPSPRLSTETSDLRRGSGR